MTDKLREYAEEIEKCFRVDSISYKGRTAPDATGYEAKYSVDTATIESILSRATKAERESCVTRAAAALESTGLNPPQRHYVLAAIRDGDE